MPALNFRYLTLLLLGFALLLKAAIPAGFMPDMGALARGALQIQICTASGLQHILVDKERRKIDPAHAPVQGHEKNPVCSFGGLAPFVPVLALLALLFTVAAVRTEILTGVIYFIRRHKNFAVAPRGPPVV